MFSLGFGCVAAGTYGYRSTSTSAPTFARPGNSCGGTAGSRVVGSPECGHIALDEVDDVDWSGGVYWCSREGAQVVRRNEVLRVALYPNPVFNEMWFLTVDPLIRISVFIAKLSER